MYVLPRRGRSRIGEIRPIGTGSTARHAVESGIAFWNPCQCTVWPSVQVGAHRKTEVRHGDLMAESWSNASKGAEICALRARVDAAPRPCR